MTINLPCEKSMTMLDTVCEKRAMITNLLYLTDGNLPYLT
ncbi:hypothetical protein SOHN41_02283 [Shewanella sp. HN-41]|nr:hypothetical protein SOHN41_02283 [Shewanella sp. HN-41]